jgi:hypothetical protein
LPRKFRPHMCATCSHPERYRIELLRAGGASFKSLGKKFGIPADAVCRHWRNHVTDGDKAHYIAGPVKLHEAAERAAAENTSLIDCLSIVRSVLMQQFMSAAEGGDRHGTSTTAGRLLQCLSEIGRLSGELTKYSSSTTINNLTIVNSPVFANFQAVVLRALAPHPAARADVIAALQSLEQTDPRHCSKRIPSVRIPTHDDPRHGLAPFPSLAARLARTRAP